MTLFILFLGYQLAFRSLNISQDKLFNIKVKSNHKNDWNNNNNNNEKMDHFPCNVVLPCGKINKFCDWKFNVINEPYPPKSKKNP